MFETERLIFRGFLKSDLDDIYNMYCDHRVQSTVISDYIVPRPETFKDTIEKWASSLLFTIVIDKASGRYVGQAGLGHENQKNRDAKFAIAIGPEWWGRGLGTEIVRWVVGHAFKELNLHRISLTVFESNIRARSVYKKVGFVEEGVLRKANWGNGQWRDVVQMGILDEDFWAQQQTDQH